MQAQAQISSEDCFIPLHLDSLHDLSGPVNQISTMLELFLKRRSKPAADEEDEVLKLILDSAGRLRMFMTALQEYAHVTAEGAMLRGCDANQLLETAVATLDRAIRESGARVIADRLPEIHCDPSQIVYLLTSLIGNALKFRGESPPEIRVSAELREGEFVFSIRDNGIGIRDALRQSIFHMFKRADGRRYPGAGAGLAISRRIVEHHGGRIWVESEIGEGCNFLFTIPCARGTQRA